MIRLFRSYKTYDTGTYENMTIWQAGRATSAAPTFFKRLEIGQKNMQEEFLDGGLGSNNPTKFLLEEMAHIYENREVSCIISIGAGKAKIREYRKPGFVGKLLPKALVEALESLATDCEETEADMSKKFMNSPNLYFRFNVDRGLEEVGLEEWKELGNITSKTNQYLLDHRLGPVISDAVLQLHKPTSKLTATYLSN